MKQDLNITVTELFLDKDGNQCNKEEAVKVYVRITDSDGNYIDGRMIPIK